MSAYLRILLFFALLALPPDLAASPTAISDPADLWTDQDIVLLGASVAGGQLTIAVTERTVIMNTRSVDVFLDADQNITTGDGRVGSVAGADFRLSCQVGLVDGCTLARLPTVDGGAEDVKDLSAIPGASVQVAGATITVILPVNALDNTTALDLFAVAHAGGFPYGIWGNGDRCPDSGSLNTATGTVVVRRPAAALDLTFTDPAGDNSNGQDMTAARIRTYGDQFEITITLADPINLYSYSYELTGDVLMDSDRSLLTGWLGMGAAIPTWGADVQLLFVVNYLSPLLTLSFGGGAGSALTFGPPLSDGRWLAQGNQLTLAASASVFDARGLSIVNGQPVVERRLTDGRMIIALDTTWNLTFSDYMPPHTQAFDLATGQVLTPLAWDPNKTVVWTDPEEFGGVSGMDLTQLEAEVTRDHLVMKGTLSHWDDTQVGNVFEIPLDTDMDAGTGFQVWDEMTPGSPVIGADYDVVAYSSDEYSYVGYYAQLYRPDGVMEVHDAWLRAQPSQGLGTGSFTLSIPLQALGNPGPQVRFYAATGNDEGDLFDVAPPSPAVVTTFFPVIITREGQSVRLTWTHDPINTAYEIHRSDAPFFVPGPATLYDTVFAPTGTYLDQGAAGNPDQNHYYIVRGLQAAGDWVSSIRNAIFSYRLER